MKAWMVALTALTLAVPAHARAAPAADGRYCCEAPAGTLVDVELAEPVGTKTHRTGDRFALRLVQPLIVDGRILLRAGTPGVGEVIQSSKPGMGGKAAKLVLAARYLDDHGLRIGLQGLQLAAVGRDNSNAANVVGLTGFAFAPLGFMGLAVPGGNVILPQGAAGQARLAFDTALRPVARATDRQMYLAAQAVRQADAFGALERIQIPPPPPGKGQVVFFRPKSLLGVGQWFRVRENGRPLGKLSNGAYFVVVSDPGVHTYSAKTEPELNDHLTLEVDPGETYFVEGALTKGVVMGEADIFPAGRGAFDQASKDLKLAAGKPLPAAARSPVSQAEEDADIGSDNDATNDAH